MNKIYVSDRRRIGAHVRFCKDDGLITSLNEAKNMGMYATQVYLGSSRSIARSTLSPSDVTKCNEMLAHHDMDVFCHASLLINLASSVKNGTYYDTQNVSKNQWCIDSLNTDISNLSALTSSEKKGVVVHPGYWLNDGCADRGRNSVAACINSTLLNDSTPLLLETCSGENRRVGKTLDELMSIIDKVDNKEGVGICVDTCHIFASGQYNLSTLEGIDDVWRDIKNTNNKVKLIHLNDSFYDYGVCKDKHSNIYDGKIWNTTLLTRFLSHAYQQDIPCVMETCVDDMFTILDTV